MFDNEVLKLDWFSFDITKKDTLRIRGEDSLFYATILYALGLFIHDSKGGLHLRTFLSSTFLSCWRHKIMSSTFCFCSWGHSNWRTKMLKTFVWYRLFFRFWEQKRPQNDVLRCKCKSTKMSSKTPIFMSSTKKSSDVNPP